MFEMQVSDDLHPYSVSNANSTASRCNIKYNAYRIIITE